MFKVLTIAATALTGLVLSSGAVAGVPKDVPAEVAAPASNAIAEPKAKETKYCVIDSVTGSRIRQKICKTRGEWIKENGFDPLNP